MLWFQYSGYWWSATMSNWDKGPGGAGVDSATDSVLCCPGFSHIDSKQKLHQILKLFKGEKNDINCFCRIPAWKKSWKPQIFFRIQSPEGREPWLCPIKPDSIEAAGEARKNGTKPDNQYSSPTAHTSPTLVGDNKLLWHACHGVCHHVIKNVSKKVPLNELRVSHCVEILCVFFKSHYVK